jgi:hypothetical protein
MADDGHQNAVAARFRPETQKPFSALRKVTRSTRPARTSCVDNSGVDFMRIAGSLVFAAACYRAGLAIRLPSGFAMSLLIAKSSAEMRSPIRDDRQSFANGQQ